MQIVDLRSDTVTHPTPEMRKAMYEAEVGDDVYREDPTIIKLEELGAQMTGKEAGLFVASGTMGNQIAVMAHTKKSDEVICETESHIFYYEVGGIACLSGAQPRPITGVNGILTVDQIKSAIRGSDVHAPDTGLICLENTHNRAGGTCYTLENLAAIAQLATAHAIPVHMDGARIFNAAAALGVSVAEIARHTQTVQFCMSKGLGAPVGSLLTGSKDFINKSRRFRKMVGGGMRQAGILAAAGLVALTHMVDRLAEDHKHARILGEELANMGLKVNLSTVQTNIVIFDVSTTGKTARVFADQLRSSGIKVNEFGEFKIRMVTHYGISRKDIDYTLAVAARIIAG